MDEPRTGEAFRVSPLPPRIAITRQVSPGLARGELTFLPRVDIDIPLANAQHLQYERALAANGCQVVSLHAEREHPDCVFIEDTAVVLDEVAIITRPGAASRRPETEAVGNVLREYRPLAHTQAPGTLDGGDVLRVGKNIYVGLSSRTNQAGIDQLAAAVAPFGYRVQPMAVIGCLHLKSAVTPVAADMLLVNPECVDAGRFEGMELIKVDPSEPMAANALLLGERVIYPVSFERTRKRLEERGIPVQTVDVSELEKAEGAVTCCSLILNRL